MMRDGTDVLAAGALRAVAEIAAHAAARAVRAHGAWFPQTEAAECPVSA